MSDDSSSHLNNLSMRFDVTIKIFEHQISTPTLQQVMGVMRDSDYHHNNQRQNYQIGSLLSMPAVMPVMTKVDKMHVKR